MTNQEDVNQKRQCSIGNLIIKSIKADKEFFNLRLRKDDTKLMILMIYTKSWHDHWSNSDVEGNFGFD